MGSAGAARSLSMGVTPFMACSNMADSSRAGGGGGGAFGSLGFS
jgi:hypothetical protein